MNKKFMIFKIVS